MLAGAMSQESGPECPKSRSCDPLDLQWCARCPGAGARNYFPKSVVQPRRCPCLRIFLQHACKSKHVSCIFLKLRGIVGPGPKLNAGRLPASDSEWALALLVFSMT